MKLARKLALTLAATALGVTMVGMTAPAANAADSGWTCGGCRPGAPHFP